MHDTHTQKAQANQHQETTPERERERHTYPVNIVWLSEIAINPVQNV